MYTSWDPERIEGPPETDPGVLLLCKQELYVLKLRHDLISAIKCCINIVKTASAFKETSSVEKDNVDNLQSIVKDWEETYSNIPNEFHVVLRQVSRLALEFTI